MCFNNEGSFVLFGLMCLIYGLFIDLPYKYFLHLSPMLNLYQFYYLFFHTGQQLKFVMGWHFWTWLLIKLRSVLGSLCLCRHRSLVAAFTCATFLIFVVSELQVWMQCSFASYEHNQNKWWHGEGKLSLSSHIESLPSDNMRIYSL